MKNFISEQGNVYIESVNHGLSELISKLKAQSIHIIADENTARHCVPLLPASIDAQLIVVPAGEESKTLSSCTRIWEQLIEGKAHRNALVLNVGGGMVCDLGGFAAACYMRGIKFAHIPTTVLAMTDAAIGGKNGIDFSNLKNYIGTIRPPAFIWIDPVFLDTLPPVEKISGLSEIVKHAIIGSRNLWDRLTTITSTEQLSWKEILEESIPVKIKIVEEDPFEQGKRKILNFGHTMGHAIESYQLSVSNPVLHGDCVATGMIIEAKISNTMGLLNNDELNDIVKLVSRILKPFRITLPTFDLLKPFIALDKKNSGSRAFFSLPESIGSCRWDVLVENATIQDSFQWFTQGRIER